VRQAKEKDTSNLIEKLVSINRVAKVVKGGRNFSFSALVVVGDGNGRVGHGLGKAREVPDAIRKANEAAQRNMIRVPLREGRTFHHDTIGVFGSACLNLRSAPPGRGIIAGGPARAVLEALGVSDVVCKSVGTSNPHNMVRALFQALAEMSSPRMIAQRRGLKVSQVLGRHQKEKTELKSPTKSDEVES
jgi:small subunit ribosomal protein S5